MSIPSRLEVQIIDKIEQQVQHCLRSYENDLLEDKLIELCREWFFKGFIAGINHDKPEPSHERVMQRTYLGDGLYASFDGYQIALAASNGIHDTNTVYLEPGVIKSLMKYIESLNNKKE